MNKIYLFLFLSIYFCLPAKAQENPLEPSKDPIREKIFVHLDRPAYLAGETMWFKINVVNGRDLTPLNLSKVVYLEILDSNHDTPIQTKVPVSKGFGSGSVYLPLSLKSGNYIVRAYTNWMKNFGAEGFFEEEISIINTFYKTSPITEAIESIAPLAYAEGFDNVGLLTGSGDWEVKGVLITLDTLETVVEEAIEQNCNLIVSFHPIIFSGIKKFSDPGYVERAVIKAIKNDVAIYSIHTALANSFQGVNDMMCQQLGLLNRQILIPQPQTIRKLITFVPTDAATEVRNALFAAGAGAIGNYDNCSFNLEGTGSYKG